MLIDAGASLDAVDVSGHTLVSQAAMAWCRQAEGDTRPLAALLQLRPDQVNTPDYNGYVPLHQTVSNKFLDRMKLLLAAGARADDGLAYAARHGYMDAIKVLLQAGANVNAAGKVYSEVLTPLVAAVKSADTPLVRLLLDAGADIHAKDSEGRDAAQIAAEATSQSRREADECATLLRIRKSPFGQVHNLTGNIGVTVVFRRSSAKGIARGTNMDVGLDFLDADDATAMPVQAGIVAKLQDGSQASAREPPRCRVLNEGPTLIPSADCAFPPASSSANATFKFELQLQPDGGVTVYYAPPDGDGGYKLGTLRMKGAKRLRYHTPGVEQRF